jgi:outer membrane cobalamin receptor
MLLLCPVALPVDADAFEGVIVRAEDGAPVSGAEVSILGRPGTARTDAAGRFVWQPDPPAPFEVLVIAPGGIYMRPVVVESLADGTTTIRVARVLHDALTVTGAAPGVHSTPAAGTTLVSRGDLETRQPANLMQALENVAGVNQVSEGQAAVPAIRGLARGRTLLLIDGARVTSERRVGPSGTYLDPFVLDDVEVVRGPGAVAYGSDAFGGVISARTRRLAPDSPVALRIVGTLGAGIPERRGGVEIGKGIERGSVLFLAHARSSDDYTSPDGEVFNSGYDDRGLLARGDRLVGPGVLSVSWQSDAGRDVERPRTNSRTVRFYYPTEDSHRLTGSYSAADVAGFSRVGTTVFLGSYGQVTDQDRFATATTGRSIERADVSAKDFHVRGFGERAIGAARIEAGVDVNGRYGLRALDVIEKYDLAGALADRTVNVSVDRAHRTDAGVYVSFDAPLARAVTLSAGARADRVTMENRAGYFGDRATSNGAGSGYVALAAAARGVTVTGQIARGFRDPMLSDRFFRGPTGRGFITGNPDLDPESSVQVDLGVRYTARRYRVGVSAYQYRIDDLIERYQTETDFFFFRNRGRGRLRGLELEAQADLGAGFTLQTAAQVARGRLLDDATWLDDVSPGMVSLQVRKTLPRRTFVQVRAAKFAKDARPGPSEVAMPGYFLLDAGGGIALGSRLDLRALVRNALDETYLVSPDSRAVQAPGVSASLTAIVRF